MMNSTCENERDFVNLRAFQVLIGICFISLIASYVLMAAFFYKYAFRLYWHLNIKILFYYNMFISFVLATSLVWNFSGLFYRIWTATEDCELVIQFKNCVLIRWLFLIAFCLTTLNHTAIVIERLWATIRLAKYEKSSGALGVILVLFMTGLSIFITYLIMLAENREEFAPTCLALSATNIGENIYRLFTLQCFTEILVLGVHKYLLWFNRKRKAKIDNLTEKFQINENLAVLEQMNPLIITCSLVIGGYNIVAIAIRPFRGFLTKNTYSIIVSAIFVIQYLPFLLTVIAYYMVKKQTKERAEQTQKSVQLDIIANAEFTNDFYNWDSSYSAKFDKTTRAKRWWQKPFLNRVTNVTV